MDSKKKHQNNGLLITGTLAILGTVIGGIIKGYMEANLAEQKFQSELVIKALESSSGEERIESLRFLIETNLVSRKDLSSGIESYLDKSPKGIPQFSTILKSHEYVFYSSESIKKLTQSQADLFCKQKFEKLDGSGALRLDPKRVVHVWGHLEGGLCIANLNL